MNSDDASRRIDRYRKLCAEEPGIPIFSRDWWLDSVCGDSWDVCLAERNGLIVASMPFYFKMKYGFTALSQPKLTQTLGPWLRPSERKYAKRLDQEKELLNELHDSLPRFHYFSQNWHYKNLNWLPFYWNGFQQTTRYTYRLPELESLDLVWSEFRENIRREVRKAQNRFNLIVRTDLNLNDFLPLHRQTFERQGASLPYSAELLERLDRGCTDHNARKIFIAEDEMGRRHAGLYIVWDEESAYYLMGGGDPELRSSGATSLCMWEAIKFAATVTKSFDFEGSMIEPVEKYFRAFGAIQTPYFSISKTPSRLVQAYKSLR